MIVLYVLALSTWVTLGWVVTVVFAALGLLAIPVVLGGVALARWRDEHTHRVRAPARDGTGRHRAARRWGR